MKTTDTDVRMLLKRDFLLRELQESHRRFPEASKGDAMKLMRIWHWDGPILANHRADWEAITGYQDITTKTLWDYIRAALVNG